MLETFDTTTFSGINPNILEYKNLDKILHCICSQLKLTKTQRERAEKAYEVVADILRGAPVDSILFQVGLRIYAQGSLLTDTSVRPIHGDEFDLDVVILFDVDHNNVDPRALQDEIFRLLKKDGRYKDIVEKKSRCIRINYKSAFHIDMMPACPEDLEGDCDGLLVPYKKTETLFVWQPSNPLGIGKWLAQMDAKAEKLYQFMEKSARADIEVDPFPEESFSVSILRSVISLLKRSRDQYFSDDEDSGKIARSIALLVMAGTHYEPKGSLFLDFKHIIYQIDEHTKDFMNLHVYNPLHYSRLQGDREDFAENWKENPQLYKKFRRWIQYLKSQVDILEKMRVTKYTDYSDILQEMFHARVVNDALNEYASGYTTAQKNGELRMVNKLVTSTGTMAAALSTSSSAGTVVRANKFYGGKIPRIFRSKKSPGIPIWGQDQLFKSRLPSFKKSFNRERKELTWIGEVKPTPYSETYRIKVVYQQGHYPRAYVISHDIGDDCIHTYSNKMLCLYHLSEGEEKWTSNHSIVDTIVPWAVLWLLHWEVWKVTGVWNGDEFKHAQAA